MTIPTPPTVRDTSGTFADRIKLLIQRVGSATEIARMCGFSEGVVRSWRDGHSDPSRARCVTLARTLGISLVWLVAGEGPSQLDFDPKMGNRSSSTNMSFKPQPRLEDGYAAVVLPSAGTVVDAERLNTAMKILQSELDLADSRLSLAESSDLLASLYEILGPGGAQVDVAAMLTFNHRLRERIRRTRSMA